MRYQKLVLAALAVALAGSCGALLGYTLGQRAAARPPAAAGATASTVSPALEILPGMSVERAFGALVLSIRVDQQFAQADIDARLAGRPLAQYTLTPAASTAVLNLANGDTTVSGSLAVQFSYPPGRSMLRGDFSVAQAGRAVPFAGTIVAWPAPAGLILARQVAWPTPELRIESDILLDPGSAVIVRLLTGPQTIATFTLSQDANSVIDSQSYAVGTVRVSPGMRIRLRPATPTQDGQLTLIGTFGSSDHPAVAYAGAIATWRYLAPWH